MTIPLTHAIIFKLFERAAHAPVAQLDRVSDSDSEGRAFESRRAHQDENPWEIKATEKVSSAKIWLFQLYKCIIYKCII